MSDKLFHVVRVAKIIPNGRLIKRVRKEKNMTVYDLARKCYVSGSYISRMERGTVKYVSKKVARKVAKCLNS